MIHLRRGHERLEDINHAFSYGEKVLDTLTYPETTDVLMLSCRVCYVFRRRNVFK